MSGWSPTRNRKGWNATVRRVLARDNRVCYLCQGPATEVDHQVPLSQHGTADNWNLKAICTPCHRTKTAREANQARRKRYDRTRKPEPHPGLLRRST